MFEGDEQSYAAIITIRLPEMVQPATITVTLTPADGIELAPGRVKALRDCSLKDLQAFADSLESELWAAYQAIRLSDIAADEAAGLKITVIDASGEPLALDREEILQHVVIVDQDDDKVAEEHVAADESDEKVGDYNQENEPPEATPVEEAIAASDVPDQDRTAQDAPDEAVVDEAEEELSLATDTVEDEPHRVVEWAESPQVEQVDELLEPEPPRIAGLRRPLGHPTKASIDILINEPAFRDAQAHALSSLEREVAGVLVGPLPVEQPDGRYVVHITDIIIAKHTRMHGASVTYTPESWRYVTDVLHERYPNEEAVFVGWYHTHPGFGIFLSGMDLFIHQNFFTQKWHVALVLDPLTRKSGFFTWDRDQTGVYTYEFPWPKWAPDSW